MPDYNNIYERLEFIKGNIIANENEAALQQTKELMDIIFELMTNNK